MLEKDGIIQELNGLGISEENYRVISLLPMVLVAWSDGEVQKEERDLIIEIAYTNEFISGDGEAVLNRWLIEQPTQDYYEKGFKVLIEIARRSRDGLGSDISATSLRGLINLSVDVASAAGGLFGKVWTISNEERVALDKVAELLTIDDGQSWMELMEDLES